MYRTSNSIPSLSRSILIGALGFCLVSLIVFATVAFAERWMYANVGLTGAYLVWIALFILLGGGALGSLVVDRWRLPKFYLLFGAAFFAYAIGWTAAYFTLRGAAGEWVGSLAASVLMAIVFAIGFGALRSLLRLSAVLFATNSIAYFLGSVLFRVIRPPFGMLSWGVIYGLFLGAGIGAVLNLCQTSRSVK
ncbi:MAG TPA: hypothetical protein VF251_05540 [Pyrinomonadaceae bacterium]